MTSLIVSFLFRDFFTLEQSNKDTGYLTGISITKLISSKQYPYNLIA